MAQFGSNSGTLASLIGYMRYMTFRYLKGLYDLRCDVFATIIDNLPIPMNLLILRPIETMISITRSS